MALLIGQIDFILADRRVKLAKWSSDCASASIISDIAKSIEHNARKNFRELIIRAAETLYILLDTILKSS